MDHTCPDCGDTCDCLFPEDCRHCEPWPEEVVNEQDEAEEAGQQPLFPYSEKDPLT